MATLLGEWGFLDNLNDTSGNGRTGTFTAGSGGSLTYVTGPQTSTKGIQFSHVNDFVDFGRTGLEPTADGLVIMGWIKSNTTGSFWLGLLSKARAGGSTRNRIGTSRTRQLAYVARWKDDIHTNDAITPALDTGWHHIALVDGNTKWALYIDGVVVPSHSGTRAMNNTTSPTWEAYSWITGRNNILGDQDADPTMAVSGIRIFQGEMTAAEIITWKDTAIVPTGVAPTITTTALSAMAVGFSFGQTLAATGSPAPTFAVTTGTLPAGLSLSTAGVLSGTPTTAGAYSFTITATNATGSDPQAYSGTVAAAVSSVSLLTGVTPTTLTDAEVGPLNLGMRFRSSIDTTILGVKFYKGSTANGGTHIGALWSNTGTELARATFTGETASGWQSVLFDTPVAITANTVYVVSYLCPQGKYSITAPYFTADYTNAILTGPQGTGPAPNGVYNLNGTVSFPSSTADSSGNFFVDVIAAAQTKFSVFGSSPPPGTITSHSDGGGSLKLMQGFYYTGTKDLYLVGARLYVPTGLAASFYTQVNFFAQINIHNGTGVGQGTYGDFPINKSLTTLVPGWNEVLFDVTYPFNSFAEGEAGGLGNFIWVGFGYANGNNYFYQSDANFSAAAGVAAGAAVQSTQLTSLYLSEHGSLATRSRNSIGGSAGAFYSIDLIVSDEPPPPLPPTWTNYVLIDAPRNGTTTHTVSPASGTVVGGTAFTPTAGRMLMCVATGAVTSTTPSGWALPAANGSTVGTTGLYIWTRTATGSDAVTTTHNGSNYPCAFAFFEFPAGSSFVSAASTASAPITLSASNPNLTGLTGTNTLFGAVSACANQASSTNATTWLGGAGSELFDLLRVWDTVTSGYAFSLAYLPNSTATSHQPLGGMIGSGLEGNQKVALTFAVNVATVTDTIAPSTPTGLGGSITGTSASLTWTASTDNVAVTSYTVHRGATSGFTPDGSNLIATVSTNSYSGTQPAGTYYFKVIAKDAAGNSSAASAVHGPLTATGGLTPVKADWATGNTVTHTHMNAIAAAVNGLGGTPVKADWVAGDTVTHTHMNAIGAAVNALIDAEG